METLEATMKRVRDELMDTTHDYMKIGDNFDEMWLMARARTLAQLAVIKIALKKEVKL